MSKTRASALEVLGRRQRAIKAAALLLVLTACLPGGRAGAQTSNEYQVKAAFLLNFVRFVDWPAEAFSHGGAPIVVGVIGADPFGGALDQAVSGKSVNGRQLVVRRFNWGEDLRACHVLFVSSSERNRVAQIVGSLRGASVLTVGEVAKFNQQGGVINFFMESSRVRFEINPGMADQARLKISSKLLALGKTNGN